MKIVGAIALLFIFINGHCTINENEVYCYIKKIGIKNPEIVLKQAIFESGHFKSPVCRKRNNIFGFRGRGAYKKFDSWKTCVEYYKKWQDKHYNDDTEDYYHFLQRLNYSGFKEFTYEKHLKKVKIQASCKCAEDEQ